MKQWIARKDGKIEKAREGIISIRENERHCQPSIKTRNSCYRDQKDGTGKNQGFSGEQITDFPADALICVNMCDSLKK